MPLTYSIIRRSLPLFLSFVFCLSSFPLLSCSKSDDPAHVIYIVSPHASDTRLEFTRAFAAWHKQKYGYEVTLKWPDYGGTSDIQRALDNEYRLRQTTCGFDVFFGGGSFTLNQEMARGHLEEPANVKAILANIPADSDLVTLCGKSADKKGDTHYYWFAATMSNFGIAINKVRIQELGLKTPVEWKDLAAPEWFASVSLADPAKSGSVLTCYEMILDQYGWEAGWAVLTRIFANAESIKDGGSNPAEETDLGNTTAGIVIDFFARNHVAKLGPDVMGFVIPKGGSSLDADPIAVLKGAPHAELAGHLIEFVTSIEGQKLWVFKTNTPGGPVYKSLGRLSMHREIYTDPQYASFLFDPTDPFGASTVIKVDVAAKTKRRVFLGDLMKAAFVDNHELLTQAWKAVNELRRRDPQKAAALERELGALPEYDGQPLTADRFAEVLTRWQPANKADTERNQTSMKDDWKAQFAACYRQIATKAAQQ